ncbi:MAG: glycogen synthase, partial [Gemmatimonadetes bacterium]|nr:glycogen synthase [Gemmatimonadota bacterium]
MNPYRIAYVTSEITPYAKTGGLADISGALPPALGAVGHDVRVFTPLYASVDPDEYDLRPVDGLQDLSLKIGERTHPYSVYETTPPGAEFRVYFIHCPTFYDRGGLYTNDPDEHARFILLQRAALESCQHLQWGPQLVHCHDWQTGLIPLYLKTIYAWDELFKETRSLLTIHNLGYQGTFRADTLGDTGLADCAKYLHQEDLRKGRIGFLKTGLMYADLLTTVSPTYAREIQTKEFGVGMDELLRARKESLIGILNGVDTDVWDPATDPHLEQRYSAKSLWRKEKNKAALLQELGLGYQKGVPAFGMITRLTYQKGINLLRQPLPAVLEKSDLRLIVLGSGEPDHESFFAELQDRFPEKVAFWKGFNAELAHRIEGGTDFFLMPSLYEPCGLNQMYSRIYGTVPIVRKTGGLADT